MDCEGSLAETVVGLEWHCDGGSLVGKIGPLRHCEGSLWGCSEGWMSCKG